MQMEFFITILFFLFHVIKNFETTFDGKFSAYKLGSLDKILLIDNDGNHLVYDTSTNLTTNHEFFIKENAFNLTSVSPDGTTVCYLRKDTDCDNVYFFENKTKKCLGTYSKNRTIKKILCLDGKYIFIYEDGDKTYFWEYDNQNRYAVNNDFSFTSKGVFLHIMDKLLVISQLNSPSSYYGIFFNLDTMYYESSTPLPDLSFQSPIGTPVDSNKFIVCDYDLSKTVSCSSGSISDFFVITMSQKGVVLNTCDSAPIIAQLGNGSAVVGCENKITVISSNIVQGDVIQINYPIVSLSSFSLNLHSVIVGYYNNVDNKTVLKTYIFEV